MPRPAVELADIFRQHGPAYRAAHALPRQQLRVMRAVEVCRTAVLGGHLDQPVEVLDVALQGLEGLQASG